jgi:RNA polymerase sigma factor (sigma-70 family)
MKQSPDNNQWFPQLAAGNSQAFKYYFEQYHKVVFYIAYKIVREQTAAEDIVSETFSKLWGYRDKIRSEEHLVGFLRLVAKNLSLNKRIQEDRRQVNEEELRYLNEEHDNNALSHHLVEVELLKNVYKAVEQLPPMCKAVFKELYFRQSTTKEAAARLGISERNVLNQKARAISLLRGIFSG